MNPKKTVILAGILVLATVYLYKVSIPKRESEAKTQKVFRGIVAGDVASIDVFPTGVESGMYQLVQSASLSSSSEGSQSEQEQVSPWEIPQLKGAVIDAESAAGFVDGVMALEVTGPIDEKAQSSDFSAYGLDKPALTIVVHDRSGKGTEVALGKENTFLSMRYAKVAGRGGIFLVDKQAFTSLNKGSSDVRAKNPVECKVEDVRELTVTSSLGTVKLAQPAVGEWRIVEPSSLPASSELVGELLESVGALMVSDFLDGQQTNLGQYRLDKPDVKIDLLLRAGITPQTRSISVSTAQGKKATFFTYDGAPSVFKTASDNVPSLMKGVDDLRENKLLKLSSSEIQSVRSTTSDGSAPVEITANKTDWDVNKKVSDPVFVDELLKDIAALKAVGFPAPTTVPSDAFEKPFLELAITKKGGAGDAIVVLIGKETAGKDGPARYAKVGQGEVVLIRDVEAKRVVAHEEALLPGRKEPTLPPLPKLQ